MRPAPSPFDEPPVSGIAALLIAVRVSMLVTSVVAALNASAAGPTLELSSPPPQIAASQPADSIKAVDALLAKMPNDPQLRFRKAVLLADQKRSAEAIAIFRKLADDFPLLPEPQNNLAVLYAERGEPDKARAALEAAMRSRPTYETIYRNLGTVNARLAGAAYARALNIDDSKSVAARLALIPVWAAADTTTPTPMAAAPAPAPAPAAAAAPTVAVAVALATPPAPAPAPALPASAPPTKVAAAAAPAAPTTPAAPAAASVTAIKPSAALVPASAPAVVTAVKPVPAPAPVAAAAAVPAKPAVTASADEAAIRKAVQDWSRAWSNKQTDVYIATYAPGFSGGEGSAAAWQAARRLRINGKKDIDVGVSDLKVTGSKTRWSASFTQSYSADSLSLVSRKTLDFESRGGRWVIVRENNGKGR